MSSIDYKHLNDPFSEYNSNNRYLNDNQQRHYKDFETDKRYKSENRYSYIDPLINRIKLPNLNINSEEISALNNDN